MTAVTLQPGDLGFDRSGAHITAKHAAQRHCKFIGRYSAGVSSWAPANAWKICQPNEIRQAEKHGVDIIAISESTIDRITEGHAAGLADGQADVTFWKSRGLAQGATVFCCWDTFPYPSQYDAVEAYLKGWAEGAAGYYEPGGYMGDPAGREMVRRGALTRYIQPNAGSWSSNDLPYQPTDPVSFLSEAIRVSGACMWQTGNYYFGTGADEDMVLRVPVGSHLEAKNGLLAGGEDLVPTDPKERAAFAKEVAHAVWVEELANSAGAKHAARVWLLGTNAATHKALVGLDKLAQAVGGVSTMIDAPKAGVLDRVAAVQSAVKAIKPGVIEEADAEKVAAKVLGGVKAILNGLVFGVKTK